MATARPNTPLHPRNRWDQRPYMGATPAPKLPYSTHTTDHIPLMASVLQKLYLPPP